MPVEDPVNDLSDLNSTWPLPSEFQSEVHLHLHNIKIALQKTFVDLGSNGGIVNLTATEFSYLEGAKSNFQQQISTINAFWEFNDSSVISAVAGQKYLAYPPPAGTNITLPAQPPEGSEVQIIDARGYAEEPDYTITVHRSGTDSITNITTRQAGLQNFTFSANGQQYNLVYVLSNRTWFAWAVSGYYE